MLKLYEGPHIVSAIIAIHLVVGAETDAEHIRVDLALDEAVDLKRAATSACYNRDFVRVQFVCFLQIYVFVHCMMIVR